MEQVTIDKDEYIKLMETSIRVKIFAEFLKDERYSVTPKVCGQFLGFKFEVNEDE